MTDQPVWRQGWAVGYDADLDRGYINNPDANIQVTLQFQHGPVKEVGGINGIQNEELVALLIMRLEKLNDRLPCSENVDAIQGLDATLAALTLRTERRLQQGVEGTERPHGTEEKISG